MVHISQPVDKYELKNVMTRKKISEKRLVNGSHLTGSFATREKGDNPGKQ